jgi:hypothetical protein
VTNEELQQLQAVIQATVSAAIAPITTRLDGLENGQRGLEQGQQQLNVRLDGLEQGQQNLAAKLEQTENTLRSEIQTVERTLTEKLDHTEQRLTKKLNDLEYLAADYQDREIRKLMRRVAIIERQLQISPE